MTDAPDTGLLGLVRDRRVLVCLGPGGVGKTTTAAAVGVGAALLGRRTLVLTIDPARRLAVAMGLDSISGEVRQVPATWWAAAEGLGVGDAGAAGPRLSAMMLDTKRACDHIVDKHARSDSVRRAIQDNPLYEQFSTALAGSHDYLAMERVYELRQEDEFDLIVLDTPPAAQAVEFLEAPRRLLAGMDTSGIDHLLQPIAAAGRSLAGGTGGKLVLGTAARVVTAGLSRFTGGQLLTDLASFLLSFSSMFPGFQARAEAVMRMLSSEETAFLVVSAPTDFAAAEALRLRRTLDERKLPFGGFVVNRFHPAPLGSSAPASANRKGDARRDGALPPLETMLAALGDGASPELRQALPQLYATLAEDIALAARDDRALRRLRTSADASSAPVALVPEQPEDVHDLGGLAQVAGHLGLLPVDSADSPSTY